MNCNPKLLASAAVAAGVIGNLAYEWWDRGMIRREVVGGTVFGVLVITGVLVLVWRRWDGQQKD